MRAAIALSLALLALGSCATLKRDFRAPEVNVANVDLRDFTTSGCTVVARLNVANPNPFQIHADAVSYALKIEDRPALEGEVTKGLEVPASGSALIDVPIQVTYVDLFQSVLDALSGAERSYTISGAARIGLFKLPFTHSGKLRFPTP